MRTATNLLLALAGLLAIAGIASAQECPECDEDGEPGTSGSYSSVDTGYVTDEGVFLVDTDWSVSDPDDPKGFWSWISVCITALVDSFEELVGYDTGFQSSTELYTSEDGVDLDATIRLVDPACELAPETCVLTFDDSPFGHLDDETWNADTPFEHEVRMPPEIADELRAMDGVDVDECVYEYEIGACNHD